uniref:EF-hand domain-containing protein n=1 Tax=Noctiluca scintillans TaxID=2966 RepID=A0A7S1FIR6_NOCSC
MQRNRVHDSYREILEMSSNSGVKALFSTLANQNSAFANAKAVLERKHFHFVRLRQFMESGVFSSWVGCVICLNALFIAITTHIEIRRAIDNYLGGARSEDTTHILWIEICDIIFASFFVFEFVVRVISLEFEFFIGEEWRWNILDAWLVLALLGETALSVVAVDLTFLRIVRLLRLFRTIRIVRVVRFFQELRLMLLAIMHSVVPLMWVLTFLVLMIFLFGALILHGVTEYISSVEAPDAVAELLIRFFDSMPMTLMTLFMSISGGISWWEVGEPLMKFSVLYGSMFVLYVSIMILATLNIVTGIFVNDAVSMAQMDRDLMAQAESEKNSALVKCLSEAFTELDTDGSGKITMDEFKDYWTRQDVRMVFALLELDIQDALSFFRLLDVDGSQELEIDEFVIGCMRLKGKAKTVDMETLMMENKRMMRKSMLLGRRMKDQLRSMDSRLDKMASELGARNEALICSRFPPTSPMGSHHL